MSAPAATAQRCNAPVDTPNAAEDAVLEEGGDNRNLERADGEAGDNDPDHWRLLGEDITEKGGAQHRHPDHRRDDLEPQWSAAVEVVPRAILGGSPAGVRPERALPPG